MAVLFCDTDCELWYTTAEEMNLKVIKMPYTIDGKEYMYDLGKETDFKGFFDKMRNGASAITSALNEQDYLDYFEPYFKKGEDILSKELRKQKISNDEFFEDEKFKKLLSDLKFNSENELYGNLGSGKININTVMDTYLKKEVSKDEKIISKVTKGSEKQSSSNSLIEVAGIDDIKVNLASCCNPVPGDRIVGYITKGYGITVHRMVCPNVAELDERLIEVKWNVDSSKLPTNILVRVNSNNNSLIDIISKAANNDIPVRRFNSHRSKEDEAIEMTVLVKNKEQLLKLMNDIKMIPEVTDAERLIK